MYRLPAPTLVPNAWTKPLRPLRGLQETRVATREESGVLGFPSRHMEVMMRLQRVRGDDQGQPFVPWWVRGQ